MHGTPITVRAEQEGVSPQEIVDRYHSEILDSWESVGINWDLYTSTGTENHHQVTQDVFSTLAENGFIEPRLSEQLFDPEAKRFLPDRYVEGTCPHCGYDKARGDQCDNCGRQLNPTDLVNPRSALSGATPEMRETEHYFLLLSKFEDRLIEWLNTRQGWRKHVLNMAIGFAEGGLQDRAITRDLEWGVEIPEPWNSIGDGKRIYVWFDAVIGYLSAAKEWAGSTDDPEAWRKWWEDPSAESYYFIGKDNIVFHSVIWPCQLMGYGGLNLPTSIPANQYVTFKGDKASASRGIGRSIGWYASRLEPDALRYALAAILPEQNDTDLSDDQMIARINEELVATWGNLVNRVLSMTGKNFAGQVPTPGVIESQDQEVLDSATRTLSDVGEAIEKVELRGGLRRAMDGAQAVNVYLNAEEPWKLVKTDRVRTATVLWTAIQAIAGLRVALTPYLPFTSVTLGEMLGVGPVTEWSTPVVEGGTPLGAVTPLFIKLDPDALDD